MNRNMDNHDEEQKSQFTLKQRRGIARGFVDKHLVELKDVESRIKDIVGDSSDEDKWRREQPKFDEVRKLLTKRWKLLNLMFMPSDENMNASSG